MDQSGVCRAVVSTFRCSPAPKPAPAPRLWAPAPCVSGISLSRPPSTSPPGRWGTVVCSGCRAGWGRGGAPHGWWLGRPTVAPVSARQPAPRHQPLHALTSKMPEKTQGFTEDQVEDFKEVFQLFDTKGDGLIQVECLPQSGPRAPVVSWPGPQLPVSRPHHTTCVGPQSPRATLAPVLWPDPLVRGQSPSPPALRPPSLSYVVHKTPQP